MDGQVSAQTVIFTSRNCTNKQLDASTADCLSLISLLRVYVKTERLTETVDNSRAGTPSNYHIKI